MKRRGLILLSALLPALFVAGFLQSTPAHAFDCGTTFDPPAPQGGPMIQRYNNCSNGHDFVMPYFTKNGSIYIYEGSCKGAGPWEVEAWYFAETEPGATYSTANCTERPQPVQAQAILERPGTRPCNTVFIPPAPGGAPGVEMRQFYTNCSSFHQFVTSAWIKDGGLYSPLNIPCVVVEPLDQNFVGVGFWRYSQTERNANYTTVFCLGTV
jgi:hypothetical protein